jgi:hypothetical protein
MIEACFHHVLYYCNEIWIAPPHDGGEQQTRGVPARFL